MTIYFPQQIKVETPQIDSDPWIFITVQKVVLDGEGKIVERYDRYDLIYKKLSETASEQAIHVDSLATEGMISVYGVANSIKQHIGRWMQEKYGGVITKRGVEVE